MLIAGATTPVICAYLNNLEILNVVIKNFTLDQEPGGCSKQGFAISCLSDIPIIMQII